MSFLALQLVVQSVYTVQSMSLMLFYFMHNLICNAAIGSK